MTESVGLLDADLGLDGFDRRDSLRLADCLSYSIPLTPSPAQAAAALEPPKLVGHTRDLSEGGLALIVPSLTFAYHHLLSPDFKMRLTLQLPSGPIEIAAVPTHDRPLGDADADMHYMLSGELGVVTGALYYGYEDNPRDSACILGLRITAMSDEDRALYTEHLRSLGTERPPKASRAQADGAVKAGGVQTSFKKTAVDLWTRNSAAWSEYGHF